jgi:DNA-binding NtrC family response regulator
VAQEDDDEKEMNEAERARILVIDDDENTRRSLSSVLEEKGYEVDVAASGHEAVAKSRMNLYNLTLVDLRLSDMDGTRLLTEMREIVPGMVKIIITGYPSLENAIETVNRGVDSYMVTPHGIDDLLHRIEESLKRQKEAKRYRGETVKEYIETRFREAATIG